MTSRAADVGTASQTVRSFNCNLFSNQDEMCIFYIMYYIEAKQYNEDVDDLMMRDCSSNGKTGRWNNWFRTIPDGADEFRGIVYKESVPKK